jgi:sugar phosphate permease
MITDTPRRVAYAVRHPKKVFYGWWMALAGTGLSAYTDGVGFWGFSNFFAAIVREFGWSQAVAAIGPSLQRLESGITAPITGFMVDRWGPRRVLLLGFTIAGFACILLSQIQNLWQYFGAFIILAFGLSASSFFVTAAAINAWFRRYRGRANGIMLLGPGLSGLLAGLWAWLIPEFGWRTVLFGAGVGFWVIGFPLIMLIRDNPEKYGQEPDGGPAPERPASATGRQRPAMPEASYPLRTVLRSRGYWQYVVSMSLMGASWAVVTFEALVLQGNGLSAWMIAFMFTWQTVSSIPARLVAGTLADYIDKRLVLAAATLMQAMAVVLFPLATTPAVALLAGFLLGSSIGSQSPVRLALQAEYWGRAIFGRVSGIQQGLASLPAIAAPVFIGWMFETTNSYQLAFTVVAATLLLAIPLTLTVSRPKALEPAPANIPSTR